MNNIGRKMIAEICERLVVISEELEELRSEEEEKYDNLPESFQNGDRGEKMQDAIDTLEYAISSVDDAKDMLEGIE